MSQRRLILKKFDFVTDNDSWGIFYLSASKSMQPSISMISSHLMKLGKLERFQFT